MSSHRPIAISADALFVCPFNAKEAIIRVALARLRRSFAEKSILFGGLADALADLLQQSDADLNVRRACLEMLLVLRLISADPVDRDPASVSDIKRLSRYMFAALTPERTSRISATLH